MWRSLFLSSTSLLVVACSDDGGGSCGPKGAAEFGLVATNGSDVSLTYGGLSSTVANDCSDPQTPDVISVTIIGSLSGGTGLVSFCIPHPDTLAKAPGRLGFDVQIIDLKGDQNSCMFKINTATVPSGTVTSDGLCDNGSNKAGYALAFNGNIVLSRTCGGTTDMVPATLTGTVAVTAQ